MKIGEKIKQRRLELGWSLQELTDKMGYANKSSVARIESGEIDPPQSKVVKFAEVLKTDITYLMDWEAVQKKNDIMVDIVFQLKKDDELFDIVQKITKLDTAEKRQAVKSVLLAFEAAEK
jgi:transcriptional regulator with XRE-family HTH domain